MRAIVLVSVSMGLCSACATAPQGRSPSAETIPGIGYGRWFSPKKTGSGMIRVPASERDPAKFIKRQFVKENAEYCAERKDMVSLAKYDLAAVGSTQKRFLYVVSCPVGAGANTIDGFYLFEPSKLGGEERSIAPVSFAHAAFDSKGKLVGFESSLTLDSGSFDPEGANIRVSGRSSANEYWNALYAYSPSAVWGGGLGFVLTAEWISTIDEESGKSVNKGYQYLAPNPIERVVLKDKKQTGDTDQ